MKKPLLATLVLLLLSGCMSNNAQRAAGIGSLAGATLGALTFKNKASGAAIGAGFGLLAGYIAGNEMDKTDKKNLSSALETTPSGHISRWKNPDTGVYYEASPKPARTEGTTPFREIELKATMPGGQRQTIYADAYRGHDGRWHLVQ